MLCSTVISVFFLSLNRLFSRGAAWSIARLPASPTNDMSLDPSLGQCPVSSNRLGPSWPISSPLSMESGQWKTPGDFCSSELTDGRTERQSRGGEVCICVYVRAKEEVERDLAWIPNHYWDIFTEELAGPWVSSWTQISPLKSNQMGAVPHENKYKGNCKISS